MRGFEPPTTRPPVEFPSYENFKNNSLMGSKTIYTTVAVSALDSR